MPEPITATWCQSGNVGDLLTPWLVKHISGQLPIYADPTDTTSKRLLGPGSILNWGQPGWIVWGSGLANEADCVPADLDLRLVRGPKSKKRCLDCHVDGAREVLLGDPGLLVSKFFPRRKDTVPGRVGIIPHYVDQQRAWWWFGNKQDVLIINVFDTVENVLLDIQSCECLYSSSLHGLVFADAYNIPNMRVCLSDSILGDGMKYGDYLASVGRPQAEMKDWRERHPDFFSVCPLIENYELYHMKERVEALQRMIMEACPFTNGVLE